MSETSLDVVQIITWLTERVPGLRIDREEYLRGVLGKNLPLQQMVHVVEHGPRGVLTIEQIDRMAAQQIGRDRLMTTGASVAAGLPGGVAMAATIPADVAQSFAFYIRTAQELAYLYGEEDIFQEGDEDAKIKLLLYIGTMFGASKASELVMVVGRNAAPILAKKFGQVTVTKVLGGIPWKIAKAVAALLGVNLTKGVAQKGIAKIVPVVGGAASGIITYRAFGNMARKLQATLRESYLQTPEDIENRISDLLAEDQDVIITDLSNDLTEWEIANTD